MAKKGFTPEQIINKLREAEILLNQGATIAIISLLFTVLPLPLYLAKKEKECYRIFDKHF